MKQGQASDRAGRQANRRNQVLCIPKHVSLRLADKSFIGFSSQCANAASSNAATRRISAVLVPIQQIQDPARIAQRLREVVLKCASNRARPQAGVRGQRCLTLIWGSARRRVLLRSVMTAAALLRGGADDASDPDISCQDGVVL